MNPSGDFRLSLVVPVYNEEAVLPEFYRQVTDVLRGIQGSRGYELIFVDDGSSDGSPNILENLVRQDPAVRVIEFSRNFGHQIALTAGLEHVSGDAAICMDADLQDPPDVLPRLVAKWREGYEVVYAMRQQRSTDSFFKRSSARLFYWLMRKVGNLDIPMDAGDFRLLDRKVLEVFRTLRESHRLVRGLTFWIGFKQAGVFYDRASRFAGETKYPLRKMVKLAWDAVTSFSIAPLRLAAYLGFLVSLASFLFGILIIFGRLFWGMPEVLGFSTRGWGSLMAAVLFLAGVQLMVLGMMGEYLGRTYDEVKRRPLYIIRQKIGFDG